MSGIRIKYKELLRLSIEQLFYENRICKKYVTTPQPDITLIPTDSCLLVMKSLDYVYRNTSTNGGCIVFARLSQNNEPGEDLLRFKPAASETLSFLMIANNPNIVNFNELPIAPAKGRIYYFSNKVADGAALRNDLHLSLDAGGVDGLNDSIKTSGANYRFHYGAVVAANTAKIIYVASNDELQPVSVINQAGQSDLTFNLSLLPAGKCQLLINNIVVDEFFYPGKVYGGFLFGVIELSLSSSILANYRIIEPDNTLTAERPFYKIRILNRQTFWRYSIHLQNNSPLYLEMAALSAADKIDFLERLNIISNDSAITFTKINLSDTAFEFISDNPVALHEKYFSASDLAHSALNVSLKKYIGNPPKETTVKSDLPYPSTQNIDASVLPDIYSDIYLTI